MPSKGTQKVFFLWHSLCPKKKDFFPPRIQIGLALQAFHKALKTWLVSQVLGQVLRWAHSLKVKRMIVVGLSVLRFAFAFWSFVMAFSCLLVCNSLLGIQSWNY